MSCCPPGSLPALVSPADYVPKGELVKADGKTLYVTGAGDKAIVFIYDIFGAGVRLRVPLSSCPPVPWTGVDARRTLRCPFYCVNHLRVREGGGAPWPPCVCDGAWVASRCPAAAPPRAACLPFPLSPARVLKT